MKLDREHYVTLYGPGNKFGLQRFDTHGVMVVEIKSDGRVIAEWLESEIGERFVKWKHVGETRYWFANPDDAMLAKLRWP